MRETTKKQESPSRSWEVRNTTVDSNEKGKANYVVRQLSYLKATNVT